MTEKTLSIAEYVDQVALLLDLPLKEEHRSGVIDNFARIEAKARLVNEFQLPDTIEAAPTFEP